MYPRLLFPVVLPFCISRSTYFVHESNFLLSVFFKVTLSYTCHSRRIVRTQTTFHMCFTPVRLILAVYLPCVALQDFFMPAFIAIIIIFMHK